MDAPTPNGGVDAPAEVLFSRAKILLSGRRWDRAEPILREAIASDPTHAGACGALAECLLYQGRAIEAADQARSTLAICPDDAVAFQTLSGALAELGDFAGASAAVEEALRINPRSPFHMAQAARLFFGMEQFQATVDLTDRGLQIDPNHVQCLGLRALALAHLQRHREAREAVAAMLRDHADAAYSHWSAGAIAHLAGRHTESLKFFRASLELAPANGDCHEGLANALQATGSLAQAMRHFKEANRLDPSLHYARHMVLANELRRPRTSQKVYYPPGGYK